MHDIGKPMIIDIVGTVNQLVKWVLTEILLFIGVILFGLSAPLIYTVGAEYLGMAVSAVLLNLGGYLPIHWAYRLLHLDALYRPLRF